MEKRPDDAIIKVRSARSVTAAAYRLYSSRLGQMLKAEWIYLLLTAAVWAAAGMLTVYGLYLFVPLVAVAVMLEGVLWLTTSRWLTSHPLGSLFRHARKHWLLLAGVAVGCLIALIPLCALAGLPLCILILAEWESQDSALLGDPSGMPAYMPYLMGCAWIITVCLQLCVRLFTVYAGYYAWGAAEARRKN